MIELIIELVNMYVMVLILRSWLQLVQADFYNPFTQTIVKLTHPVVSPIQKILPSRGSLDLASLTVGILIVFVQYTARLFLKGLDPNVLGIIILSVFGFIHLIGETVFWVMIMNVILSWISQGRNPIHAVIHQLTYPLLAPIKRFVPPVGMIDFSVMILLFGLYFLDYLHAKALFYVLQLVTGS